jgi:hypothetical protein
MTPFRLSALVLLAAVLLWPTLRAADEAEKAPDLTEQRNILQMDLERLYDLIARDSDPQTKVTLLGHHRVLAARANALLEKFDPGKFDELRYDINIQCQRLARKQAPLAMPPVGFERTTIPEIALEDLNPSPANPTEVKAALDVVDLTIKRMEERLGKMTAGSNQYLAERERVQRIKERRAQLAKQFTTAAWNGLVGDAKL